MYLLTYTVNNSIKMLIMDTWNNKYYCNIEIKANRSRTRPMAKSMDNKKLIVFEKNTVKRALARAQC